MLYAIQLIILGILAVPSLILSRKPDAKELLDKLTPYQGWIGVVFCVFGILGLIQCILAIGLLSLGFAFMLSWILWLVVSLVQTGLGFIMGYGLIAQYVLSKNPTTAAKGEQLLAKLTPLQGKLGIAAIIIGLIYLILPFILALLF